MLFFPSFLRSLFVSMAVCRAPCLLCGQDLTTDARWLRLFFSLVFFQLLFLLVALAASEMCNTIPAGYSDTGCYLVAARAYCPELVARPAWYQEMRDRSLLDARISNIMSNPDATGTACCLRPLTGRNKGTSQVVCARTAAPTSKPRVRPPTGVAVPGDKLTGWPSECSGAGGLSLKKIQQLLGAGGVGPVKLGKGAYVQRTRTCTQVRRFLVEMGGEFCSLMRFFQVDWLPALGSGLEPSQQQH